MAQLCNAMKGGDLATARKLHKELYNLCKMLVKLVQLVKLVHHVSVKVVMWRGHAGGTEAIEARRKQVELARG